MRRHAVRTYRGRLNGCGAAFTGAHSTQQNRSITGPSFSNKQAALGYHPAMEQENPFLPAPHRTPEERRKILEELANDKWAGSMPQISHEKVASLTPEVPAPFADETEEEIDYRDPYGGKDGMEKYFKGEDPDEMLARRQVHRRQVLSEAGIDPDSVPLDSVTLALTEEKARRERQRQGKGGAAGPQSAAQSSDAHVERGDDAFRGAGYASGEDASAEFDSRQAYGAAAANIRAESLWGGDMSAEQYTTAMGRSGEDPGREELMKRVARVSTAKIGNKYEAYGEQDDQRLHRKGSAASGKYIEVDAGKLVDAEAEAQKASVGGVSPAIAGSAEALNQAAEDDRVRSQDRDMLQSVIRPASSAASAPTTTEAGLSDAQRERLEQDRLSLRYKQTLQDVFTLSATERLRLIRLIYHEHYKTGKKYTLSLQDQRRKRFIEQVGMNDASMELKWIVEAARQRCAHLLLSMSPEDAVEVFTRQVKRGVIERIDLHKPLSYIVGDQPFLGLNILCESPVLIPRPETEQWVGWTVDALGPMWSDVRRPNNQPRRVLDMCCGSGCIGLAMKNKLGGLEDGCVVDCVDLDTRALRLAEKNARRLGFYQANGSVKLAADPSSATDPALDASPQLTYDEPPSDSSVRILRGNMFTGIPEGARHQYDIIVSNPPYITRSEYADLPKSVKVWESKEALLGVRGDYYSVLCQEGPSYLRNVTQADEDVEVRAANGLYGDQSETHGRDAGGSRLVPHIVMEIGEEQAMKVGTLFDSNSRWKDVEVHLDYCKKPRWVTARLAPQ